ncbi:MAG: serine protease [candidate division KSB1 bacterium]|nr:serine protease [candidate division KSB1 bacterium]
MPGRLFLRFLLPTVWKLFVWVVWVLAIGLLVALVGVPRCLGAESVPDFLQTVSVTVLAESTEGKVAGSGVLVSRAVDGEAVTYVWTAAHVVFPLREKKYVIAPDGKKPPASDYKDAWIVRVETQNGRAVGESRMLCRVMRVSLREDLAVLEVRKRGFSTASIRLYTEKQHPGIGQDVYHVGSFLGVAGANSMSSGIVSQVGRLIDELEYDQMNASMFPGSSGGGVFLRDGRYIGMGTRAAGETFSLYIPLRRIRAWAEKAKVLWALDATVPVPKKEERDALGVEDGSEPRPSDLRENPMRHRDVLRALLEFPYYESRIDFPRVWYLTGDAPRLHALQSRSAAGN